MVPIERDGIPSPRLRGEGQGEGLGNNGREGLHVGRSVPQ